jgi:hypothetical protein
MRKFSVRAIGAQAPASSKGRAKARNPVPAYAGLIKFNTDGPRPGAL